MELGLSLGSEASKPNELVGQARDHKDDRMINKKGSLLGFCMGLPISPNNPTGKPTGEEDHRESGPELEEAQGEATTIKVDNKEELIGRDKDVNYSKNSPLIQLDLLPNTPVPRSNHDHLLVNPSGKPEREGSINNNSANNNIGKAIEVVDIIPSKAERIDLDLDLELERHDGDDDESPSPPNSAASSFQMEFSLYRNNSNNKKLANCELGDHQNNINNNSNNCGPRRASSFRASDEEDNGSTRKKLRLSKEQSAFLEQNFKEHSTLNPKQKLALAKQLNLRPRQVEVWFQNRRARTKLKQTELDCEYLKRCCETLTEENRRLHKELQELRALKTCNPFYKQPPATTLTMCPSCERVSTANINSNNNNVINTNASLSNPNSITSSRPRFYPFSLNQQTASS